jgi:diguanylate cyclase (GGDEF)-like protein
MGLDVKGLRPADRRRTGKLALLRKADLFSGLDESELTLVARYSGYYTFSAGEVIFPEGSNVQELVLIREGNVVIRKREEGGQETDIARFITGEVFGEMDLLDAAPRDAAAVAETAASLLIFPERGLAFRDILDHHPLLSARMLQKLLGVIAGKIRATDRLLSEKTPWIQELRRQLQRDKLTSLYNRAFLEEELPGILSAHSPVSLLVVKPDNFKTINDTYGHDAGDRTLVLLAAALKSRLGEGEIGVRYRGDEFCAVLPGKGTPDAARKAAEILSAVAGIGLQPVTGDAELALTASAGITTYPDQAPDARGMISRSFQMMLEAREAGGRMVRGQEQQ